VSQVRERHDQRRGLVELAEIGRGVDGVHAGKRFRGSCIDAGDAGVSVRTSQDGGL
jgi:hypothetical protein